MPVTSVSEGVSTLLPALVGALCPLGGRHWAGLFNAQKFLPSSGCEQAGVELLVYSSRG